MKNINFEEIGDVNYKYNYLIVFYDNQKDNPFMEIGISSQKELVFKLYSSFNEEIELTIMQWQGILDVAKKFLPMALENASFNEKNWGDQEWYKNLK